MLTSIAIESHSAPQRRPDADKATEKPRRINGTETNRATLSLQCIADRTQAKQKNLKSEQPTQTPRTAARNRTGPGQK
jgi:hypothetical protein